MAETRTVQQEIAPKLAELSANVLFGDVWERPGLSKRDRSLITVAIADRPVPHRPAPRPYPARPGQWGDERGNRRSHHAHGILQWVAHSGQRRAGRQAGF